MLFRCSILMLTTDKKKSHNQFLFYTVCQCIVHKTRIAVLSIPYRLCIRHLVCVSLWQKIFSFGAHQNQTFTWFCWSNRIVCVRAYCRCVNFSFCVCIACNSVDIQASCSLESFPSQKLLLVDKNNSIWNIASLFIAYSKILKKKKPVYSLKVSEFSPFVSKQI